MVIDKEKFGNVHELLVLMAAQYDRQLVGEIAKDGVDLLESMLPHVLSFDDAVLDSERDVFWVEIKDDYDRIAEPAIPMVATNDRAAVLSSFGGDDGVLVCDRILCGKKWRPWSSKPSKELMEATAWE